jgi:large subunit ribosomal protein L21
VMRHFRDRKVIVYKMQPKKKTRKKRGHRQEVTRWMVDEIVAG